MNIGIHDKNIINIKTLFFTTLLLISITSNLHAKSSSEPNVILIYADDLGYGDLSCQGATKVQTPNIDKLAAEGRKFSDAHSASAVCTPSRYSLITGEYPYDAKGNGQGFFGPLSPLSPLIIDKETLTIGKVFQNKGYATACLGKWHLGFGDDAVNDWQMPLKSGPTDVGFDYYWGVPLVNSGSPFVYVENHMIVGYDKNDPMVYVGSGKGKTKSSIKPSPTMIVPEKSPNRFGGALKAHELYRDDEIGTKLAGKAVEWIDKNKKNPFFLYLATTNIHHPFTPAKRFVGTSQAGLYGDFIHELDWIVGEVVKSLEKNKLTENTLIIITSDNGGMLNATAQKAVSKGHKINGELLGFKFGVWEGGHRVPFIAKWPKNIPAGSTCDDLICSMDLLSAFVSLTKQEKELSLEGKDAKNILPALLGEKTKTPVRDHLVLSPQKSTHVSLRKGDWVYIPQQGSGGFTGSKVGGHGFAGPAGATWVGSKNSDIKDGKIIPTAAKAQLYNIKKDRNQTVNVHDQHSEIVEEMKAELYKFRHRPSF